jgi:hypothetical protein
MRNSVWTMAIMACLAVTTLADVPREITFQGKLTGNGTDPVSLEVRLYDAATGGNLLWSELHPSVSRPEGLFTINIGSQTVGGVPDAALDAPEVWLGVSVNEGDELTPRTRLVMVPYAAKSASSEKLVAPGTLRDVFIIDQNEGNDCAKLMGPEGHSVVWLRARSEGHGLISFNEVDGDYAGAIGVASGGGGSIQLKAPNDTHTTLSLFPIGDSAYLSLRRPDGGETIRIDGRSVVDDGTARLTVDNGGNALNTYTADFKSSGSVAGAGGILFSQHSAYAVKAYTTGINTTNGALRFAYVNRDDGSAVADNVLKITANGISTPVITITGADVAERFPTSDDVEPGSVVEIDPASPGKLRLAREPYSGLVAGVASGAGDLPAGAVLGDQPGSEHMPPIALAGRVWVKSDASYGAIRPGDRLTTSATAGHAMKVSDNEKAIGAIIGKAMTGLNEGKGLVLVLVQPQ